MGFPDCLLGLPARDLKQGIGWAQGEVRVLQDPKHEPLRPRYGMGGLGQITSTTQVGQGRTGRSQKFRNSLAKATRQIDNQTCPGARSGTDARSETQEGTREGRKTQNQRGAVRRTPEVTARGHDVRSHVVAVIFERRVGAHIAGGPCHSCRVTAIPSEVVPERSCLQTRLNANPTASA